MICLLMTRKFSNTYHIASIISHGHTPAFQNSRHDSLRGSHHYLCHHRRLPCCSPLAYPPHHFYLEHKEGHRLSSKPVTLNRYQTPHSRLPSPVHYFRPFSTRTKRSSTSTRLSHCFSASIPSRHFTFKIPHFSSQTAQNPPQCVQHIPRLYLHSPIHHHPISCPLRQGQEIRVHRRPSRWCLA